MPATVPSVVETGTPGDHPQLRVWPFMCPKRQVEGLIFRLALQIDDEVHDNSSLTLPRLAIHGSPLKMDSELDPALKRNHARRTVPAEAYAKQSCGRRDGAGQCAKSSLRSGVARCSRLIAGQRKVGVIEDIERLRIQSKTHTLRDGNSFRQIHLGVGEMRSANIVAAGVAKLAIGWRISAGAGSGAGIDDRREGIRVQPLATAGRCHV